MLAVVKFLLYGLHFPRINYNIYVRLLCALVHTACAGEKNSTEMKKKKIH